MPLASRDRPASAERSGIGRVYGAILSALHALTGVAWITERHIHKLATSPRAVCWPLFPECQAWRTHFDAQSLLTLTILYIALGVVGAALFLVGTRRAAFTTFVVTTALGAGLYALDYRLRFNQVYMLSWTVVVFLLVRRRHRVYALQALIASFYFWAGTLKLNHEWVSGAALYKKPWLVPASLVPASCWYVLVLELVFVWGLFSSRPKIRWAVYAQLVLFHVVSFSVVGYYYPILMIGLSAIFPVAWSRGEALTLATPTPARAAVVATVAAFAVFQLVPHAFPGDTALTGEGRLFALHMFDARIECTGGAMVVGNDGSVERRGLIDRTADTRTRCDPVSLYATARFWCDDLARRGDSRRLDVDVRGRRASDTIDQPLIVVRDFCHAGLTYSPFHHNAWIGAP